MSSSPGSEEGSSARPYLRLPLPVVTVLLLAFLVALLALGLYANRNLRPTAPVAEATATPPPLVLATATRVPAGAAPLLPTPTAAVAAPTPVAATQTPSALLIFPPTETSVPSTATVPAAEPSTGVTPRPTVSPDLAAEIGDAYQQYWQVRAEALYDLDTSHLNEVMAGDHLAAAEELIAQLRTEGRAINTKVTHNYVVFEAAEHQAKIADEYIDDSVYVDLDTRETISKPVGNRVREQYQMDKTDGVWRVVSLVRAP